MRIKGDVNAGNYEILNKTICSEYQRRYKLQKGNKIYYLKVEDYRNADFMYEKFYTATMVGHNSGKLKTINTKNFKEL